MKISDIIRLSGRIFKTRRLRTALTIAGIGVGIGAILFLVSFGYGLQNILLTSIASSEQLLTLDVSSFNKEFLKLDKKIIQDIEELTGVNRVIPQMRINGQIVFNNLTGNASINIVDKDYFNLAGSKFIGGAAYSDNNINEVVVSKNVIKLFNLRSVDDILGQEINLSYFLENDDNLLQLVNSKHSWKIAGVIEDVGKSAIYLPTVASGEITFDSYDLLKVVVEDSDFLNSARSQILDFGLQVSSISDTIIQAKRIFRAIQIVLGLFGVIALVVSAIGMFNTMTIALLERTQEIGIMKAIGAADRDIWSLFLSESVAMGFLGGITGIIIGLVGSGIFNFGLNILAQSLGGHSLDLFYSPLWFIVTIIIISVLVGFFTGLYPSYRAAKLSALDALRYK